MTSRRLEYSLDYAHLQSQDCYKNHNVANTLVVFEKTGSRRNFAATSSTPLPANLAKQLSRLKTPATD